jgi:predicted secreted protein
MSDYGTPPPPPPAAPDYSQPAGAGGTPPPNYLVWAILTTLFCCLPLGVASIVFAAQVNSKWAAGDRAGAVESSEKAKKFAMWSAIAGVIVGVLYAILLFAGVLGATTTDTNN